MKIGDTVRVRRSLQIDPLIKSDWKPLPDELIIVTKENIEKLKKDRRIC